MKAIILPLLAAVTNALLADSLLPVTSKDGKTVQAEVIRVDEAAVRIRTANRQVYDVPRANLDATTSARMDELAKVQAMSMPRIGLSLYQLSLIYGAPVKSYPDARLYVFDKDEFVVKALVSAGASALAYAKKNGEHLSGEEIKDIFSKNGKNFVESPADFYTYIDPITHAKSMWAILTASGELRLGTNEGMAVFVDLLKAEGNLSLKTKGL